MIIYGVNPVREALKAGRVRRLAVSSRDDPRLKPLADEAARRGLEVETLARLELDRRTGGGVHQGVMADVQRGQDWSVETLVRGARDVPLLVVLDGIEDPHNLGAILRSCDAAGADGVIRQTRRAAPLSAGTVAKASAGASAHVRAADVVNIARAVDELKALGVWTVGLAAEATQAYDAVDFRLPTAIVLGGEGGGLRRLVRERCDWLVRIPMRGHVSSLNVSVAAGIVLFEALRQRNAASVRPAGSCGTGPAWPGRGLNQPLAVRGETAGEYRDR